MRIETVHPKEIGPDLAGLWRSHQAAAPALASPYLTPEWAKIVGAARADARVAVIDGGRGFLGVQRNSSFAAMGLGAPIADYQGVVGDVDLVVGGAQLCRALKVGRIDLTCAPAEHNDLVGGLGGVEGSWIADVSDGVEAYRAHLKKHRNKIVRQTDNRQRKLEEEHGRLAFNADAGRGHFETLIAWKTAQLRATGQPAIWSARWVREVLEATYAAKDASLSGVMFSLTAGEALVGAAYCLRSERALHVWLLGHDAAFDAYSPGVILCRWIIEWAAQQGLKEVDFGVGEYQFKRHLSTGQRILAWGALSRPSMSASLRQAQIALRTRMEAMPQKRFAALPGKAMRRLDVMRGLASAR